MSANGRQGAEPMEVAASTRRRGVELLALALLLLLAWLLWSARGALPAFVIGVALALVLDPGVTLLRRRGVPRWAGVLAMYLVVVALVWAVIAFAVAPLGDQLRTFLDRLPEFAAQVGEIQRAVNQWYASLELPPQLREAIDQSVVSGEQAIGDALRGFAAPVFGTVLRTAGFIAGLVIIPIWLFFVLKDRERLPDAVALLVPPTWRADTVNALALLAGIGGRWVRGQLLLGASIFVATAIGLTVLTFLGFEEFGRFTLVLALISGILEWFPVIGPVVAAIPAILIGLTISPEAAIAAVILYTAIQQLENNILVPRVMGDAVDLHPAVMILSLIVGGALFGLWGAVLAAPVVASARDLYRYAFLRLSGEPPSVALDLAVRGVMPPPPSPAEERPVDGRRPQAPAAAGGVSRRKGTPRAAPRSGTAPPTEPEAAG